MNRQDNIINICIDEYQDGKISGRMYHCYDNRPWVFSNEVQMLGLMESFFDKLSFPQASMKTRTFIEKQQSETEELKKVTSAQAVVEQRGKKGSFLVSMRYRQNSSWQGDVSWIEGEHEWQFVSELELLKIMSNALEADRHK